MLVLHGRGDDGTDALPLARRLQAFAPEAAVAAPNAPITLSDLRLAWLPDGQGGPNQPSPVETAEAIIAFADAELQRLGLGPEKLIIVGFSQGGIMGLNIGLRRAVAPAAVIAFSGPYLDPAPLGPGKPPVLLIHGEEDSLINPINTRDVVERLTVEGFPVESHVLDNLGHGIDRRSIDLAGALLKRVTT
jgi:phospholipase/carboxylesterase